MFILFSYWFDKKFTIKNSFYKFYLKLSLPVLLKWILILPNFSLMVLVDMFLTKKNV